ncbi:hypothetical protein SVAN01_10046 [Stagonosporopsis vannaccii]|nr:hypothetical protein SVAN01_10046 [Stagonosporopsis vannaccii]
MLDGGPKYLDDQVFLDALGQTMKQNLPISITLPHKCDPILMDRLVTFLYTTDYNSLPPNKGRTTVEIIELFENAFFVPTYRSSVREAAILTGNPDHTFHLHMFALGEQLKYNALKTVARAKLLQVLTVSLQQPTLSSLGVRAHCVNACFAPLDSPDRWCIDEDSALQQMIVAVVLYCENRSWNTSQIESFNKCFSDPQYDQQYSAFNAMFNDIEAENADILAAVFKKAQSKQFRKTLAAAVARSALASNALNTPTAARTPPFSFVTHLTDEAKRRRAKKIHARRARTQRVDVSLATNASACALDEDTEGHVQNLHSMGSRRALTFLGSRVGARGVENMSERVDDDDDDHKGGEEEEEEEEEEVDTDLEMEDGMIRMAIDDWSGN